jgi:hypothetical protein
MVGLRRVLALIGLCVTVAGCLPAKNSDGGGGKALTDAACSSKTLSNCASNSNCQVSSSGTACVGTTSYCKSYTSTDSCPVSSCQWNGSCVPYVPYVQTPAPNTNPVGTSTPNVSCSALTQMNCLQPNCFWQNGQCVNAVNTNQPQFPNPTIPGNTIDCTASKVRWNPLECAKTPGCFYYTTLWPIRVGCDVAGQQ